MQDGKTFLVISLTQDAHNKKHGRKDSWLRQGFSSHEVFYPTTQNILNSFHLDSFATSMTVAVADVATIQAIIGHASMTTFWPSMPIEANCRFRD